MAPDNEGNDQGQKANYRYSNINSLAELVKIASEESIGDHNAVSTPSTIRDIDEQK